MNLNQYMIPAQEGLFTTDTREQRIELLKQHKCLIVITTSRSKYGGINVKKYVARYGFTGVSEIKMRMEEEPSCDDPDLNSIMNRILDQDKSKNACIGSRFIAACDAYSKVRNQLVVIVYDFAPYYKEDAIQKHPCVIVNSSRLHTTIKEIFKEGHSFKVVAEKYKKHEFIKEKIPKDACVRNPSMLKLFHITPVRPDKLKQLDPRVTHKPMDDEYYGTARISAAPSIDQCFKAIGTRPDQCPITYHVYQLKLSNTSQVIKPSKKLVPDVNETGEYWVLTSTPVIYLGYVRITYDNELNQFNYEDHIDSSKIKGWTQSLEAYTISENPNPILNGYSVKDVQKILDSANEGHHKDYKETIYRDVNEDKGFIEMYRSKDGHHIGTIAIVVNPKYRKQGVGLHLIQKAISKMSALQVTRLEWYCKRSNVGSKKLAEKAGFKIDPSLCNKEWYTLYYGSTEK